MAMMNLKDVKRPELEWVSRSANKPAVSTADVTINVNSYHDDKKGRLGFIFRNEYTDLFNRIDIAIFKNRVYFRESENGWKVSKQQVTAMTSHCQFANTENTKELLNFVGDYAMKYDEIMELYYIEKVIDKPRAYVTGKGYVR